MPTFSVAPLLSGCYIILLMLDEIFNYQQALFLELLKSHQQETIKALSGWWNIGFQNLTTVHHIGRIEKSTLGLPFVGVSMLGEGGADFMRAKARRRRLIWWPTLCVRICSVSAVRLPIGFQITVILEMIYTLECNSIHHGCNSTSWWYKIIFILVASVAI